MDKNYPLPLQSVAGRAYNAHIVVRAEDLTETTANTAQVLNLLNVKAGQAVRLVHHKLVTAFKDASDSNFNTCAATVGDGSDPDRLLTSTELNENGTEVDLKFGPSVLPVALTAATVSTADGSDAGTTQTLANALKAELNKVIADQANILAALVAGPMYIFSAADTVDLTVNSMADKSLSNIDVGELHLFFYIEG